MAASSNSRFHATLILLSAGLGALGLLVGTLLAFSSERLVQGVIAAIFTLFGGSLLSILQRLNSDQQVTMACGILAVSLGTLTGTYSGVYVNQHQLLTPETLRVTVAPGDGQESPPNYLKNFVVPKAAQIDTQYRAGQITCSQAYDQLTSALRSH